MDLVLEPDADGDVAAAARAAVARAGLSVVPGQRTPPRAWWGAGLAEAIERDPSWPTPARPYEDAPSPRRTRGATRA
jgi:hypothetical protein